LEEQYRFMFKRLFETLAFFKTFVVDIARFLIPVTLPVVMLETSLSFRIMNLESAGAVQWLPFLVGFLFRPVYTAGLIWLLTRLVAGTPWTLRECLGVGIRCWSRLLVVYLASSVLIFAGLLAFLIPGLIVLARLSLAEFGVVLEGMGPRQALARSNERVRGFTADVVGSTLVLSFLLVGLDVITNYLLARFSLQGYAAAILTSLVFLVLSSSLTILFYRFYDLALRRETSELQDSAEDLSDQGGREK